MNGKSLSTQFEINVAKERVVLIEADKGDFCLNDGGVGKFARGVTKNIEFAALNIDFQIINFVDLSHCIEAMRFDLCCAGDFCIALEELENLEHRWIRV